jgi:pimeloyl-ACP methyl ester carboxylesterase
VVHPVEVDVMRLQPAVSIGGVEEIDARVGRVRRLDRLRPHQRGPDGTRRLFGFRRSARLHPDELRRLSVPTLVIWGDHEPVGPVGVARTIARLLPEAQLEILPGGHVPCFGDPQRTAALLSEFVRP